VKEDVWLIGIVFVVWGVLSLMYFTIPMIHMPVTGRVWGLGALIFVVLAVFIAVAQHRGRGRRRG
jgi:hypothetical protein